MWFGTQDYYSKIAKELYVLRSYLPVTSTHISAHILQIYQTQADLPYLTAALKIDNNIYP